MNRLQQAAASSGFALLTLSAVSMPAAADASFDQVFVAGNAGWVATGIVADSGDRFDVRADGQVKTFFQPGGGSRSGPDGQVDTCANGNGYVCAAEGAPWGALIGRFGDGEAFVIGSRATGIVAGQSGELMLAVNDYVGTWFDNTGGYVVKVR